MQNTDESPSAEVGEGARGPIDDDDDDDDGVPRYICIMADQDEEQEGREEGLQGRARDLGNNCFRWQERWKSVRGGWAQESHTAMEGAVRS